MQKKTYKKESSVFLLIAAGILCVMLFNFAADPYYVFNHKPLKGFNDKKIHLYTNRRQMIFSDMKLNGRRKTEAFTGNCSLYRNEEIPYNTAFYTLPVTDITEIKNIIEHTAVLTPGIKKLYLGLSFNDIFEKDRKTDEADASSSGAVKDFINLLFSWNTLKYSIETVQASIQNKEYVYPYREIARKTYAEDYMPDLYAKIEDIKEYAAAHKIKLIFYIPPSNITFKINLYEKGLWGRYTEFKKALAGISEYIDYSLNNEYNTEILDGSCRYYIDNLHISPVLNKIIIDDIRKDKHEIGIYVNKYNVNSITDEDTAYLEDYIKKHKELAEKIKNLKPEDAEIKIPRIHLNT